MLVRRHQKPLDQGHTRPGNAALARVLVAIAVLIVEHLADQVAAVEQQLHHDLDHGRRLAGHRPAIGAKPPGAVDVFARLHRRRHRQRQLKLHLALLIERDVGEGQHPPSRSGSICVPLADAVPGT